MSMNSCVVDLIQKMYVLQYAYHFLCVFTKYIGFISYLTSCKTLEQIKVETWYISNLL